jgi:hypothetical protein
MPLMKTKLNAGKLLLLLASTTMKKPGNGQKSHMLNTKAPKKSS